MSQFIGQIVKRRMTIYFVIHRVEKSVRIFWIGSVNIDAFDRPNADAFLSACIHIARHFDGHLCIRSMETANVFVV